MARYMFRLPDIGEGIAEAEIVAWHVKVGDSVKEDQPLADMMTDKATVEMESPVAGKVRRGGGRGRRPDRDRLAAGGDRDRGRCARPRRAAVAPRADERRSPTARIEAELPMRATSRMPPPPCEEVAPRSAEARAPSSTADRSAVAAPTASAQAVRGAAKVLASPAVRAARQGSRHRPRRGEDRGRPHPPRRPRRLPALQRRQRFAPRRGTPAPDETIKVVGLRRRIAENMAGGEAPHPAFHLGRGMRRHRPRGHARDLNARPRRRAQADPAAAS